MPLSQRLVVRDAGAVEVVFPVVGAGGGLAFSLQIPDETDFSGKTLESVLRASPYSEEELGTLEVTPRGADGWLDFELAGADVVAFAELLGDHNIHWALKISDPAEPPTDKVTHYGVIPLRLMATR